MARIKWLKDHGKIVIADYDDYWEPDMRHPMFLQAITSGVIKSKIEILNAVDYVTVTTPTYRDLIHNKFKLNNVYVFPNAIDENEPQFRPNPISSDKIRFGYLGGSSHFS